MRTWYEKAEDEIDQELADNRDGLAYESELRTAPATYCANRRKAMSNDRYQEIRDALAMGPTPGPWKAHDPSESGWVDITNAPYATPLCYAVPCSDYQYDAELDCERLVSRAHETPANAAYIAACDPDTIRELLAERDQLDAEIEALRAEVDALRKALGRILENEASDWKAAEEFGGYVLADELREEARAAIRKAKGE